MKPQTQGHIDGLCAVYTVVNACKLLFDHSEKMDQQLFKALCLGTSDLFPKIVYDGTEVVGVRRLLDAAVEWTRRAHKCDLVWSQPLFRQNKATVEDYSPGCGPRWTPVMASEGPRSLASASPGITGRLCGM